MTSIKEFLAKNPSLPEILKFIESRAEQIADERRKEKERLRQESYNPVVKDFSERSDEV